MNVLIKIIMEITVQIFNGDLLQLHVSPNESTPKKILETLSEHFKQIRKHRARLVEKEPGYYYLFQNPPNVSKYIKESEDGKELHISIEERKLYETNADDLIDWLDGYDEKTYETVVIEDSTLSYRLKLLQYTCYQQGNDLPVLDFEKEYYRNYDEFVLGILFSLISEKLKPLSVEWIGPRVSFDLFTEGFPLVKTLALSYPIDQEELKKLYSFSQLEEFSLPVPPTFVLDKEHLPIKLIVTHYTFERRNGGTIHRGKIMGEFLY